MNDELHGPPTPAWCPIPRVADTISEMHTTLSVLVERIENIQLMTTTRFDDIDDTTARIEARQEKQNGAVVALQSDAYRVEGAVAALKWLIGLLLGLMGVGVAFAGLILARGG